VGPWSAGRRIATATGCGFHRGAGPGLTMSPGVSLPSTMAAGWLLAAFGAGCRLRRELWLAWPMCDRCTRQLSLLGLAAPIGALRYPLAAHQRVWRGSRSGRVTFIARRTASASATWSV